MSDEKRSKGAAQDWLGLAFFATGAFLAFSIAMFWIEDGAREDPNPTTAVVIAVTDALGRVPSFASGLLVALLGGLLFFLPRPVSSGRHLAGIAGLLLGTAMILGAASPGSGGAVGVLFDGLLGRDLVIASGVLGAFIVIATVWVTWIPSRQRIPMKLGESSPVSAALREGDAAGVSSAEAAALLPLSEGSEPVVPAHPIDVRLRGVARERQRAKPSSVHGPKAPHRSGEDHEGVQPAGLWGNAHERVGADLVALLPAQGRSAKGRSAAAADAATARAVAGDPSVRVLNPKRPAGAEGVVSPPIWELGGTLDVERAPAESAESELESPLATEWEPSRATPEVPLENEPEFAWPSDDLEIQGHEPVEGVVEVVAEDEESEDAESWEDDDSPADDDDEEEDDEEDEDEEDEDEDESDEDDEEDEDEEDEDEDEDEDEEDEDEDEDEEDDLEEWGSADQGVSRVAFEAVPAFAQEKTREPPSASKPSERSTAHELGPVPRKAPARPTQPRGSRATSGARTKVAAGAVGRSHDDLLLDAGLMIIERGRVAVSMVQREFEMDFKTATNLLDELQDRGVIGPYLGGRHRDILLSREEWMAIAPVSS